MRMGGGLTCKLQIIYKAKLLAEENFLLTSTGTKKALSPRHLAIICS